MILPSQLSFESHAFAATIHISGPLSLSVVARAIARLRALPARVRAARVDLRAVTACDHQALRMLDSLLLEWRDERRGVTHVAHARLRRRDAFVAFPCALRDAAESELRPERDDRVVSAPPYSLW